MRKKLAGEYKYIEIRGDTLVLTLESEIDVIISFRGSADLEELAFVAKVMQEEREKEEACSP